MWNGVEGCGRLWNLLLDALEGLREHGDEQIDKEDRGSQYVSPPAEMSSAIVSSAVVRIEAQ